MRLPCVLVIIHSVMSQRPYRYRLLRLKLVLTVRYGRVSVAIVAAYVSLVGNFGYSFAKAGMTALHESIRVVQGIVSLRLINKS